MNIAVSYFEGDKDQAERLLRWILEIGALRSHKLYLQAAKGVEPLPEILPHTAIIDYAGVRTDWSKADVHGGVQVSAAGANSAFRNFARYFQENQLGTWFFCEPDAIPITADCFDQIEAEHIRGGKPYSGALVPIPIPHMSGNACYDQNSAHVRGLILPMMTNYQVGARVGSPQSPTDTREIAFDVASARDVLPQAHTHILIQHEFRAPEFTSMEDYETRVRKDAVLYHSNKGGSIFPYLRNKLNLSGVRCSRASLDQAGQGSQCMITSALTEEVSGEGSTHALQGGLLPNTKNKAATSPPAQSPFAALSESLQQSPVSVKNGQSAVLAPASGSSAVGDSLLERRRAHAANMRAKLAEKRASGAYREPKHRKRKKRAKSKARTS